MALSAILRAGRLASDGLETIPTVVPQEGDGYRRKLTGRIVDERTQLTNEDLQCINTRKALI